MGMKFADLYRAPEINPVNRKARAIPVLNPVNPYGRVFFFSWFGFMVAFWAWYTFPPLLTATIKHDLHLTTAQVANSNIVSICATLIVRFIAGPLCDQFGPRKVFAGTLLVGAIPIGLAPLVQTANGLYASRFFIGILGGSFVPCQVWSTGFFDKNVVGTANALTGGWGNAGGGITYFVMPAVYDSFVRQGHSMDQAWRLTFLVPLAFLLFTGVALLLLAPDTPVGKWSERKRLVQENLRAHGVQEEIVAIPGSITEKPPVAAAAATSPSLDGDARDSSKEEEDPKVRDDKLEANGTPHALAEHEAHLPKEEMVRIAQGEVVVKPTPREILRVAVSPQSWTLFLGYACSFGGELAINSVLSSFYLQNFPYLGQTGATKWAAMFGFLNFVTRPLGGIIADALYSYNQSVWLKKGWLHLCGLLTGALLIIIGRVDPSDLSTFNGLLALMAIFLEAGNGANFAVVPHVHPHANGIVSGFTGGIGNLGGVIFAIIFRFMDNGTDYPKAFWVIGCINLGVHALTCWIPPIPKGQIGGR
ncbi:unnamed protein product [Discula destructiva]